MATGGAELSDLWEVDVIQEAEADLHRHNINCQKNSQHSDFLPIGQFDVTYLPDDYHDNDLVKFIRALADVTVRVAVSFVSHRRPSTYPNSQTPYPYCNDKGKEVKSVGTGVMYKVVIYQNKSITNRKCNCDDCLDSFIPESCVCKDCLNSSTPETKFAHVYIYTATHVVYDDTEAEQTTCNLLFDTGNLPVHCKDTINLKGMSYVRKSIEEDWCTLEYITHDINLAERLDNFVKTWHSRHEYVRNKFRRFKERPMGDGQALGDNELTIIISHPHGCSKQISIGNRVSGDSLPGNSYRCVYTTATCAGSSGAPVCVVRWDYMFDLYYHAHSGHCAGNNLNYSNTNFVPYMISHDRYVMHNY